MSKKTTRRPTGRPAKPETTPSSTAAAIAAPPQAPTGTKHSTPAAGPAPAVRPDSALTVFGYHLWRTVTLRADFKKLSYPQPAYFLYVALALALSLSLTTQVVVFGLGASGIWHGILVVAIFPIFAFNFNIFSWWIKSGPYTNPYTNARIRRTWPLIFVGLLGAAAVDLIVVAAWGAGLIKTTTDSPLPVVSFSAQCVLFGSAVWRFLATTESTHHRLYVRPWFR